MSDIRNCNAVFFHTKYFFCGICIRSLAYRLATLIRLKYGPDTSKGGGCMLLKGGERL